MTRKHKPARGFLSKRSAPALDAQAVFLDLVRLEVEWVRLVKEANAAWEAGKRAKAKRLARLVVGIEREREGLLR